MKALKILFIVAAVLSSTALEVKPVEHKNTERRLDPITADETINSAFAAVPKRTESDTGLVRGIDGEGINSPHVGRRLQLYLVDDDLEKENSVLPKFAYAALLMDDHDRGIRTLGQSLIDSRTAEDLVAILAPGVTLEAELRVQAQGWKVRRLAVDGDVDGEDALDITSLSGSVRKLMVYQGIVLCCTAMMHCIALHCVALYCGTSGFSFFLRQTSISTIKRASRLEYYEVYY